MDDAGAEGCCGLSTHRDRRQTVLSIFGANNASKKKGVWPCTGSGGSKPNGGVRGCHARRLLACKGQRGAAVAQVLYRL